MHRLQTILKILFLDECALTVGFYWPPTLCIRESLTDCGAHIKSMQQTQTNLMSYKYKNILKYFLYS